LKTKLAITASLLLVCLLGGSCAPTRNFDGHVKLIVKPYLFSIAKWECEVMLSELNQWISGRDEKIDDEVYVVTQYFSLVKRVKMLNSEIEAIKSANGQDNLSALEDELDMLQAREKDLHGSVERIIKRQIKETLAQQGIFNPIDKYIRLEVGFPPVNFKLEEPPYLLVISPRDRIESIREIILLPSLSLEEIEDIEARVDRLGISSLVVKLGGLGATCPTFVANDASLRFVIDTATEEWLHQYLVFKPLGFLYLLDLTGVSRNYEIATMNETVASMVSKEIGSIIYEKYYYRYENDDNHNQGAEPEFDFNLEMREIRRVVDKLLAQGEIEQAEEFMEQKRQYLASMGYRIRKLNQAYFAFHGVYADSPTSISPIGLQLQELRSQSVSLADFLSTVAGMTSAQDLRNTLGTNSL